MIVVTASVILSILVAPQPQPEGQAEILKRLRSENIEEREVATKKLIQFGNSVLPFLERAIKEESEQEVIGRVKDIIKKIHELFPVTIDLGGTGPFTLVPSRAGKYLVLLEPNSVRIFEAGTLKFLKAFPTIATAAGFDQKDTELTIVGRSLQKLNTGDWGEKFARDLPKTDFNSRNQAWIDPQGEIYYVSTEGLIHASVRENSLRIDELITRGAAGTKGILGMWDKWLILNLGGGAAVSDLQGIYVLPAPAQDPLVSGVISGRPIIVYRDEILTFRIDSLKSTGTWKQSGTLIAAIDNRGARIFVSNGTNLKVIQAPEFENTAIYKPVNVVPLQIAIDDEARLLYVVSGSLKMKLQCWRLIE